MALPTRVFISHVPEDREVCERLCRMLAPYVRDERVTLFREALLPAGSDRQREVDRHLDESDLFLLLVSPDYVASDAHHEGEVKRALARARADQADVVPIVVRPTPLAATPYGHLQALPSNGAPASAWPQLDEALLDVVSGLEKLFGKRRREPPAPRYKTARARELGMERRALEDERRRAVDAHRPTEEIDRRIVAIKREQRAGARLEPGELLSGRYELLEVIGHGGFGTVWKAYDRRADTVIAVKVLETRDNPERETRFFRGARVMKELGLPHVVPVLDPECRDDGQLFYTMRYVDGGNFEQAVLQGRLDRRSIYGVLIKIAETLAAAHERGVVHRDVKPANIVLDSSGTPYLTDFDLALTAEETYTDTVVLGSVLYAAPELLDRNALKGPPADVYALGMTAIFALLGKELPPTIVRSPASVIWGLDCSGDVREALTVAVALAAEGRCSAEYFIESLTDESDLLGAPEAVAEPTTEDLLIIPGLRIGQIELQSSIAEALRITGSSCTIWSMEHGPLAFEDGADLIVSNQSDIHRLEYPGKAMLWFRHGRIERVTAFDTKYRTAEGFGVGTEQRDILSAMGPPARTLRSGDLEYPTRGIDYSVDSSRRVSCVSVYALQNRW